MVSNLAEFGRRDSHLLDRAHSQLPFQLLDAPMQRLDHVPPYRRLLAHVPTPLVVLSPEPGFLSMLNPHKTRAERSARFLAC